MTPDWRIASDYDYVDDLSLTALAFEFLRRNPEYRRDFRKYSKIEGALAKLHGPKPENYAEWKADWATGAIFDPPKLPDETHQEWRERALLESGGPRQVWYEEWYTNRWGILSEELPDPAKPLKGDLKFDLTKGFPTFPDSHEVENYYPVKIGKAGFPVPSPQAMGLALVGFDLEAPLVPQINAAKAELKKRQNLHKQSHEMGDRHAQLALSTSKAQNFKDGGFLNRFKGYIRLLDADLATDDVSDTKIGEVLFGDVSSNIAKADPNSFAKKIWNQRMKAHQYRDIKYRAIPTWEPPSA